MGYPMTYRRVINRNGLAEGGYGDTIRGDRLNTKVSERLTPDQFETGVNFEDVLMNQIRFLEQTLDRLYAAQGLVLGDLRRLESDAVDEQATCQHIASRTGVDQETVAAVLKEFMAW